MEIDNCFLTAVSRNIVLTRHALANDPAHRPSTFSPFSSRIPLNVNFNSHIVWLSLHALPSGIALIIGPFQFLTALRMGWRSTHRTLGKIYLCCVVLGSLAAISSTLLSEAGFAAQMGFALLTAGWLYSALSARGARAASGRIIDSKAKAHQW